MKRRCRVCGGTLTEPLLSYPNMPSVAQHLPAREELASDIKVTLKVCQCEGCGLVQLDNEPVPYFREVIRAAAFSPEMRGFRKEQFADWIARHGLAGRRILEAGCGRGEYLELLSGVEAWGMEYGEESVSSCRKTGLQVIRDYPGEGAGALSDHAFDGFLILNWLEHLPDPGCALDRIGASLSPGGVGLVEVPNFDITLRNGRFTEFTRDHLFYFTTETLTTLLKLHGFEVLSCRKIWYDYILSVEVRKRPILSCAGFEASRRQLLTELERFIGRDKVAVWGAGHQALMVLAAAGLGKKICYVVDSAAFKQGKYTPATHLPIVSPERLRTAPPDAVIVLAASYCDEVAAAIRADFGDRFRLALLRGETLEIVR